jgi:hypothetical protein
MLKNRRQAVNIHDLPIPLLNPQLLTKERQVRRKDRQLKLGHASVSPSALPHASRKSSSSHFPGPPEIQGRDQEFGDWSEEAITTTLCGHAKEYDLAPKGVGRSCIVEQ